MRPPGPARRLFFDASTGPDAANCGRPERAAAAKPVSIWIGIVA